MRRWMWAAERRKNSYELRITRYEISLGEIPGQIRY